MLLTLLKTYLRANMDIYREIGCHAESKLTLCNIYMGESPSPCDRGANLMGMNKHEQAVPTHPLWHILWFRNTGEIVRNCQVNHFVISALFLPSFIA